MGYHYARHARPGAALYGARETLVREADLLIRRVFIQLLVRSQFSLQHLNESVLEALFFIGGRLVSGTGCGCLLAH